MSSRVRLVCALALVIYLGAAAAPSRPAAPSLPSAIRERLQQRLEASSSIVVGKTHLHAPHSLRRFYEQRAYEPVWTDEAGLLPRTNQLMRLLQEADQEGLKPDDYHLAQLTELLRQVAQAASASLQVDAYLDLDLLLSDAFFLYASHILSGRVNPETIKAEWFTKPREADLVTHLHHALESEGIEEVLRRFLPAHEGYIQLREAFTHYRQLATMGGWATVPDGPKMQRGDQGPRVLALRKRLRITGDLDQETEDESDVFDLPLERVLQRFQQRHGLLSDGVVGPATRAALNVSAEARAHQIAVNLERWRWLPATFETRYILVNIANGQLDVIEHDQSIMSMRVIVGKAYRKTPVFSGRMIYLVLNPSWNIPPRIAIQDILPLIRRNPRYLATQRIKVLQGWGTAVQEIDPASIDWQRLSAKYFPYHLRQEPGALNALGRVKFMLPNPFNVYLHDTPSRELFAKSVRTFSSGCIRIEKPIDMATYVLRGRTNWTREAILAAIASGVEQTVALPEPIPVHLLYWTAWVDPDGTVQFRQDIYHRDPPLDNALREPLSTAS